MTASLPLAQCRLVVVAFGAAVALAACSSTTSNANGDRSDAADSRTVPSRSGPAPVPTGDSGQPLTKQQVIEAVKSGKLPSSALPADKGAAATAGSGGSRSPSNRGAAPVAPAFGPGVSATEIKIGIVLIENGGSFGSTFGVATDFGNTRAQSDAVIRYLNARGGIAGRTIKPVYYTFDLGRVSTRDGQAEEEACAKWTQDDRVFAVINAALARPTLLSCLAKVGVPGVHDQMPVDEGTLATQRSFYYSGGHVGGMTLDRLARSSTQVFAKRGFFGKDAVVGIVHFDDPAYVRVVDQQYRPALKAAGVTKVVTQAAPRFLEGQYSTYVSQFQASGVTHVMFLGEAGGYPLLFMQAAENQLYRPKYGLRTDNFPGAVLQGAAPKEQLKNSMSMGWMPSLDVDAARDPGPVSSSAKLCLEIQREASQNMDDRGARGTALGYCNGLFFLRDSLAKSSSITSAELARTVSQLGASFVSPQVFGTRYSSAQHDGVGSYRDLGYGAECSCFNYTGPIKQLS